MAATRSRPRTAVGNGVAVKAKEAGSSVASVAERARGPLVATGAAAAGLAGGLAIGTRMGRRRGRAHALAGGVRLAVSAASKAAGTADEIRMLREQLERLNRRSPVEVLLDGLTHRRGAHRYES